MPALLTSDSLNCTKSKPVTDTMCAERRALTVDGVETHMCTNFLGPSLLTLVLLPALRKAVSARSCAMALTNNPACTVPVTLSQHLRYLWGLASD